MFTASWADGRGEDGGGWRTRRGCPFLPMLVASGLESGVSRTKMARRFLGGAGVRPARRVPACRLGR